MTIQDSGDRTEFSSGAVRDMHEDKGRCDLLPLDVIADYLTLNGHKNHVLDYIYGFICSGETRYLENSLDVFNEQAYRDNKTMILEVAIQFEEGAKKYGERNWEKGIPVHCYIDSAVRHYIKWLRGDKDERHDRAFAWNILCCLWTIANKPEMCDMPIWGSEKGETK